MLVEALTTLKSGRLVSLCGQLEDTSTAMEVQVSVWQNGHLYKSIHPHCDKIGDLVVT